MSENQDLNVKLEPPEEIDIQPISIVEVEETNIKKETIYSTDGSLFEILTLPVPTKITKSKHKHNPKGNSKKNQQVVKPSSFSQSLETEILPRGNKLANRVHKPDLRVSIEKQINLQLTRQPQHNCNHCGCGFLRQSNLTKHIKRNVCTQKHQTCPQCQKVFNSQANLNVHMLSHTNCDICGEVFGESTALEVHKKSQHNEKKHRCIEPNCSKSFKTATTLIQHTKYAHEQRTNFICSICKKSFELRSYFNEHMLRHKQIKRFKCEECGGTFYTTSDLAKHIRRHSGERPYACDVCKKKYFLLHDLSIHKRTHTGERPYACEVCPMRFVHLSVLKKHRRIHTGQIPCK